MPRPLGRPAEGAAPTPPDGRPGHLGPAPARDRAVPARETQPELAKEEIRKNQQYAECMQEHGAPDFPDTGADGHFRDVTWDSTSAGAKRATRACASIIGIPDNAPTPQG
ncbi:hypothetical protein [Streptomyces atratus]|uniref:hypothetical protein n=1 Tax=Streptomyces atratus TaxID=1893 RepID=UPI0033EB3979